MSKTNTKKIALWVNNTNAEIPCAAEVRAYVQEHGVMPDEMSDLISVTLYEIDGELRARFDLV